MEGSGQGLFRGIIRNFIKDTHHGNISLQIADIRPKNQEIIKHEAGLKRV
jgi:hypothetical protein